MAKWYAGVPHSHTTRSDGAHSPEKLIEMAIKKGLDFIMITDHNQFCDPVPYNDKITVIPGTELTTDNGHTNFWGVRYPFDNFNAIKYEEWLDKVSQAKENGAMICINHPKCSACTWLWPLEPEKADCVEVWNSPQHTDNMICTAWWQDELRKGKKIPVVGGSDFHRNYVVTDFLAHPVTYVYAESNSQEDILAAIKTGRTTITNNVGKSLIEIKCGDAIIGDTVKLTDDTKVTITVSQLNKNHTLKVIAKSGTVFEYKADKDAPYSVTLPVKDTNFICAQIEYINGPVFSFIYDKAIGTRVADQKGQKLPPFIYAQTGAMYFEP